MKCPYCGGKSRIIDTRRRQGGTKWRRHVCRKCGLKFSTYEMYSGDYKQVRFLLKRENMSNEAWELFASMCEIVCKNENVYVQAFVVKDVALIQLLPLEEE